MSTQLTCLTLPETEGGSWHFLCLSRHDRVNVGRGYDPTLHSLETLISHVVLIAHHLIVSNLVIKTRERTWADDMKPKSVSAHITLAIQYDPREDVLPLSYSRGTNSQGTGTIDLQRLEEFGIEPRLLRGRVLKARTQPYDVYTTSDPSASTALRLTSSTTWCSKAVNKCFRLLR